MKKIMFLSLVLLCSVSLSAQSRREVKKDIKATDNIIATGNKYLEDVIIKKSDALKKVIIMLDDVIDKNNNAIEVYLSSNQNYTDLALLVSNMTYTILEYDKALLMISYAKIDAVSKEQLMDSLAVEEIKFLTAKIRHYVDAESQKKRLISRHKILERCDQVRSRIEEYSVNACKNCLSFQNENTYLSKQTWYVEFQLNFYYDGILNLDENSICDPSFTSSEFDKNWAFFKNERAGYYQAQAN